MIRFLLFIFLFALGIAGIYKLIEWIFDVNIWLWLQKSLFWKHKREEEASKEVDKMWQEKMKR